MTSDRPTRHRPHAVVVGSGPGGGVAALLLARTGWTVTVLERVAAPAAVGGGLLLQPNGLAVLAGLGLDAAPGGHPVTTGAVRDGAGRVLLETVGSGPPGLDRNLVVRRSALFGAVHERLAAESDVEVRLGATAEVLVDGGVRVATMSGRSVVQADLVVAADGARSALRAGIAPDARVVEGPTYLRAVVDGAPAGDGSVGAAEWWTPLGLFGCAPLGDGATYLFASTAHPDLAAALADGDVGRLAAVWGSALPVAGDLLGRVRSAEELMVDRADEVRTRRWVTDRAALLGDAAHAMVPNTGQGANSALLDAAVLAIELDAAATVAAGLEAYARRRRRAVAAAQSDARLLARLAHVRSAPARRLRDVAIRGAALLPADRRTRRLHQEDPVAIRDAVAALAVRR